MNCAMRDDDAAFSPDDLALPCPVLPVPPFPWVPPLLAIDLFEPSFISLLSSLFSRSSAARSTLASICDANDIRESIHDDRACSEDGRSVVVPNSFAASPRRPPLSPPSFRPPSPLFLQRTHTHMKHSSSTPAAIAPTRISSFGSSKIPPKHTPGGTIGESKLQTQHTYQKAPWKSSCGGCCLCTYLPVQQNSLSEPMRSSFPSRHSYVIVFVAQVITSLLPPTFLPAQDFGTTSDGCLHVH